MQQKGGMESCNPQICCCPLGRSMPVWTDQDDWTMNWYWMAGCDPGKENSDSLRLILNTCLAVLEKKFFTTLTNYSHFIIKNRSLITSAYNKRGETS